MNEQTFVENRNNQLEIAAAIITAAQEKGIDGAENYTVGTVMAGANEKAERLYSNGQVQPWFPSNAGLAESYDNLATLRIDPGSLDWLTARQLSIVSEVHELVSAELKAEFAQIAGHEYGAESKQAQASTSGQESETLKAIEINEEKAERVFEFAQSAGLFSDVTQEKFINEIENDVTAYVKQSGEFELHRHDEKIEELISESLDSVVDQAAEIHQSNQSQEQNPLLDKAAEIIAAAPEGSYLKEMTPERIIKEAQQAASEAVYGSGDDLSGVDAQALEGKLTGTYMDSMLDEAKAAHSETASEQQEQQQTQRSQASMSM